MDKLELLEEENRKLLAKLRENNRAIFSIHRSETAICKRTDMRMKYNNIVNTHISNILGIIEDSSDKITKDNKIVNIKKYSIECDRDIIIKRIEDEIGVKYIDDCFKLHMGIAPPEKKSKIIGLQNTIHLYAGSIGGVCQFRINRKLNPLDKIDNAIYDVYKTYGATLEYSFSNYNRIFKTDDVSLFDSWIKYENIIDCERYSVSLLNKK